MGRDGDGDVFVIRNETVGIYQNKQTKATR